MLRFRRAESYWWRKPLVRVRRRALPAELAVLALELRRHEQGSWLNVRPKASGIVELAPMATRHGPAFRPKRAPLPFFVVAKLEDIYSRAGLSRGCPELVIWRTDRELFRLVAVKWRSDRRRDQRKWDVARQRFIEMAWQHGVSTKFVEWEFADDAA